jgi:hypothetical protein
VAAGLRAFWQLVGEEIARLVFGGQRVLRLRNGEFNGGSVNRAGLVLSRAAMMKRSGQRRKQSELVWDVLARELSGLSANL